MIWFRICSQSELGENKIDYIENNTRFIEKMRSLKKGESKKVRILHLGDSHIQATAFSMKTREKIQQKYGNGGRGILFPYQLAGTIGPFDYSANSVSKWSNSWIINENQLFPIGIAGIGVQSVLSRGSFRFDMKELNVSNSSGFFAYNQKIGGELYLGNRFKKSKRLLDFDTLSFSSSQLISSLISFDKSQLNCHFMYVENDIDGVVYNSIGVAGAKYIDYLKNPLFFKELPLLNLDLIIISLGTNELYSNSFSMNEFSNQVEMFLVELKKTVPNADILISGPPDHRKKKDGSLVVNPSLNSVRIGLKEIANKHKVSYWDLFEAMGGEGCIERWAEFELVNKDYMHYRKAGYEKQGKLLYDALEKCLLIP